MLNKVKRLFYTMRHLKMKQLAYFLIYRRFGFCRVPFVAALSFDSSVKFHVKAPSVGPLNEETQTLTFLNCSRAYDVNNFDWRPVRTQRLWCYNLHYFEYLNQANVSDLLKSRLIVSWIVKSPQGCEPAWEPYTASLRIVNWVKYFCNINEVDGTWNASLFEQSCWLRKNLEYHILANHYFENIKALAFASVYFSCGSEVWAKKAQSWQTFICSQLEKQLVEQFLADGGHYERSPQYHSILIKDCIELYRLFYENKTGFQYLLPNLKGIIERGYSLLCEIQSFNSRPPLLNDSALGEYISPEALRNIASGLNLDLPETSERIETALVNLPEFGVYGIKSSKDWLMIDCGDIGPSYQPGHTHCDFLSYEWMLDGVMVVVDSGVLEYEPGVQRQRMRSTRAHNTVMVDGVEQSQIWGEFRVAKRAKRLFASLTQTGSNVEFKGAYSGFFDFPGGASHFREINVGLVDYQFKCLKIKDEIKTEKKTPDYFHSFIHFHPDVKLQQLADFSFELTIHNGRTVRLKAFSCSDARIEQSIYSPDFGIAIENKTLVLKSEVQSLSYIFEI